MKNTKKFLLFRSSIVKLMGLLVAPLIFSILLGGALYLVASASMGDIIGYGSLLLMKPSESVSPNTDMEFKPLSPDAYAEETVDIRDITFPTYEQVYGEISIPAADIYCPLVYGDTNAAMRKGAGQYIGSRIIGYGGTSMICAHVNRQFKNLHTVEVGDEIQISTAYGVYTYEVKYVGVHSATDKTVYDLGREDENVVLYTCYYQKTALGSVKMRFFVCADYVSGPMIVDRGNEA